MKNYTLSILGIISGLFVMLFVASFIWLTWETIDVFATGTPINKWPPFLFLASNVGILVFSQLWQRRKNQLVRKQMEANTKAYQEKFREALRNSLNAISKVQQEARDQEGHINSRAAQEEEGQHTKQGFDPDEAYHPKNHVSSGKSFDPDGLL